jgi:hypothetical protein
MKKTARAEKSRINEIAPRLNVSSASRKQRAALFQASKTHIFLKFAAFPDKFFKDL